MVMPYMRSAIKGTFRQPMFRLTQFAFYFYLNHAVDKRFVSEQHLAASWDSCSVIDNILEQCCCTLVPGLIAEESSFSLCLTEIPQARGPPCMHMGGVYLSQGYSIGGVHGAHSAVAPRSNPPRTQAREPLCPLCACGHRILPALRCCRGGREFSGSNSEFSLSPGRRG